MGGAKKHGKGSHGSSATESGVCSKRTMIVTLLAIVLGITGFLFNASTTNILTSFNEGMTLSRPALQTAFMGFCLNSGVIETLANKKDKAQFDAHQQDMESTDFLADGNINEDEYTKQSIYSLLYSIYYDLGAVRFHGELYSFRFNTWGLGGVFDPSTGDRNGRPDQCAGPYKENHLTSYPASTVQRHGKTAYSSLLNFKTVKEKMRHITEVEKRLVNVVEIGSGTGAGANELTWIHPSVNYTAVDMQARGASTCKALHASAEGRFVATPSAPGSSNPATFSADTRLTCLHANGQKLKDYLPDNFADIVLISETHIADVIPLDQETQNVLLQVKRLLRPGGLFVWGNAIPTSIWGNAFYFLRDMGMKREEVYDVTDNAVAARDEDFSRVEHWYEQARKTYYGLNFFSRCNHAVNRLFLNFCRHPGTALYKRMLSGSNVTEPAPGDGDWCEELDVPTSLCKDARIDSYVQMCYSLPE